MSEWLQRAASWTWQNSVAAAVLAAVLLSLRMMLRGRVPPLWLCLGGALVMARLFLPAPLPNAWAWDGAWSRLVESMNSSSKPVAPPAPVDARHAGTENETRPEATEAGAEWQPSDLQGTQSMPIAPLPSFTLIPSIPPPSTAPDAAGPAVIDWRGAATWSWAGGALLFFGLATARHWRFVRRLRRMAQPVALPWPWLASECAQAAGSRRVPALLTVNGGGTPFLCGWLRPCIILPANTLASLTEREARHVLIHEMLHAARHDLAVNWLLAGVRSLHWFNPFVHVTVRRWLADRELLRDSQALALLRDGAERAAYGRTLLKLALTPSVRGLSPGFAPFFRSEKELKRRLTMIHSPLHTHRVASVAAAACLITLGAWLFTTARAQQPPPAGDAPAATSSPVAGLPPITVPAPESDAAPGTGTAPVSPPTEIASANAEAAPTAGEPPKSSDPETTEEPAGLPPKAAANIRKTRKVAAEAAARQQKEAARQYEEAAKQHHAAARKGLLGLRQQIAAAATEAEKQKLEAEARALEAEATLQADGADSVEAEALALAAKAKYHAAANEAEKRKLEAEARALAAKAEYHAAAAAKHAADGKTTAIENLRQIAAALRKEGRKDEAAAIDSELNRLTKSADVPMKIPAAPEDAHREFKQLRAEMAEIKAALAAIQKHQSGELDELARRTKELRKYVGDGYGPKHPKVQAIRTELAERHELLAEQGDTRAGEALNYRLLQEMEKNSLEKPQPKQEKSPAKTAHAAPRAEATTKTDQPGSNLPWGVPVPGKFGLVWSPFAPEKGVVDVSGYEPKTVVKCPFTGNFLYVPQLPKSPQVK